MKVTLIICTYKRSKVITNLLDSVEIQTLYPDEILIIDGSPDYLTKELLEKKAYKNLIYHKVPPKDRGLTKQRNFGIDKVNPTSQIVAFLDDDIVLNKDYFKYLISVYKEFPNALAVGGYINNEAKWFNENEVKDTSLFYCYDGYCRKESSRFRLRSKLYLAPNRPPAHLPKFSHGRSVGFLPPSKKTYKVEQFMGGVSSYKKEIFKKVKFSTYFEGYGLYEDADFCFRLLNHGEIYVNTAAQCEHHHHPSGRPNQFKYGQMVVKNGWYVWRLRWPNPGIKNIIKWHANVLLLTLLRFLNIFTVRNKKQALTESSGRFWAWLKLFFARPKILQ